MKKPWLIRTALTLFALMTLSVAPTWAGKLDDIKKTGLRVCLEPGYAPFIMLDQNDKIIGFDPDLAEIVAKALGAPKLELVNTTWKEIIPALLANKCDIIMSGMSITDERRQQVDFTTAYIVIGQTALLRKAISSQIESYTDLNDPKYKILSRQGSTSEAAAKTHFPKAQLLMVATQKEAVEQLLAGKADAFIYDSPFNAITANQHENDLVFLDSPFTSEPIGWAIAKGNQDFLNWLNGFIEQANTNSIKFALYRKWFKSKNWLKTVKQ